jgi:hypothetical protein
MLLWSGLDPMRRSLDEALSLLVDPHRLYTEAPEGINLMLIQAVCEENLDPGRRICRP